MKKIYANSIFSIVLCLVMFCGCGLREIAERYAPNRNLGDYSESQMETADLAEETADSTEETPDSTEETADLSKEEFQERTEEASSDTGPEKNEEELEEAGVNLDTGSGISGSLSENELSGIERKLNSIGYYGFMRSFYHDSTEILWEEVFYDGAGLNAKQASLSEEVRDAYLKATGDEEEIFTDLIAVSGEDVKSYVKKTTGHEYSEMKNQLGWVYLEDYDLFVSEHGDTNYSEVRVTSGYYENGVFHINYTAYTGETCCVSFAEENGVYRFISNERSGSAVAPAGRNDADRRMTTQEMLLPDSAETKLNENENGAGL